MAEGMKQAIQKKMRLSALPGLGADGKSKKANETGMYWDENLDMFTGGSININLYENCVGYYAG